jgi:transcriptional regulator with XRE-family HTH domain
MPRVYKTFDDQVNSDFGSFIRERRLSMKLGQNLVASLCPMTPGYLNDIEHGNRPSPSEEILEGLRRALELNKKQEKIMYYDLAAKTRNSIQKDVSDFLIKNPNFVDLIRKIIYKEVIGETAVKETIQAIEESYKAPFEKLD